MTPAEAIERFMPQIKQAAKNATRKYPSLRSDALSQDPKKADEEIAPEWTNLLGVAAEQVVRLLDSGQIAEWEAGVGGDQNQVDRYVLQALNKDMLDYARKVIHDDDRTRLAGKYRPDSGAVGDWTEPDTGDLSEYPLLRMKHGEGLTQDEIAERLGIPARTVRREMKRERDRFLASLPEEMLGAA